MPNSIIQATNRKEDIKLRGEDCLVLNINHDVVKLKNAHIMYDKNNNYMQPETYVEVDCCVGCCII
jgi:hypothetical protein